MSQDQFLILIGLGIISIPLLIFYLDRKQSITRQETQKTAKTSSRELALEEKQIINSQIDRCRQYILRLNIIATLLIIGLLIFDIYHHFYALLNLDLFWSVNIGVGLILFMLWLFSFSTLSQKRRNLEHSKTQPVTIYDGTIYTSKFSTKTLSYITLFLPNKELRYQNTFFINNPFNNYLMHHNNTQAKVEYSQYSDNIWSFTGQDGSTFKITTKKGLVKVN